MNTLLKAGLFAALFISLQSSVYAAIFTKNLSLGAKGTEVVTLQQFLISKGFLTGMATGYFGVQTKKSVQSFQKQYGLPATGAWMSLSRQKAETVTSSGLFVNATSSTDIRTAPQGAGLNDTVSNKGGPVVLTVDNTSGGYISFPDGKTTCYSDEKCTQAYPAGTRVTLKAYALPGYYLTQWSEATCGTSTQCTVLMNGDVTVHSYFKVLNQEQLFGHIVSPHKPSETCYIPLGWDKCNFRFTWVTNSGYDTTIEVDGTKYYLQPVTENDIFDGYKLDPADIAATEQENAAGPVYFDLPLGKHDFVLRARGQQMDTGKVEVKCSPDAYWEGTKCWMKDAKSLITFKQQGTIITSDPPVIKCGYHPEACFGSFPSGAKVTLKATVANGYVFKSWNGDCAGETSTTCVMTMNSNKQVGVNVK